MPDGEWVTFVQAGRMIGCSQQTVQALARAGRFDRRRAASRRFPPLGRSSVERVSAEAEGKRATARRLAAEREERVRPPDDEHVWLSTGEAAALIGWTTVWIRIRARDERIPGTFKGRRWWFRREDIETFVAARAFRQVREQAEG